MKQADIIKELSSNNSRIDKEKVIKREYENKNEEFFIGCRMALEPLVTFGVKEIPLRDGEDGVGLEFDEFTQLLYQLSKRHATGNYALSLINELMQKSTNYEWNYWYRRILAKDLDCGVGAKTINKATKSSDKHYSIKVFDCMLAHDSENHKKKLVGEKLMDCKLDGVRCISVLNKNPIFVTMYSRNGKVLSNFSHIGKELAERFGNKINKDMVFDGEVVSSSFQNLMTQVHRKDDVDTSDALYSVFDMLPLDEFINRRSFSSLTLRNKNLRALFSDSLGVVITPEEENANNHRVRLLPKVSCNLDTEEGKEFFENYRNKAIVDGYEGVMIKDPKSTYEYKRSFAILKWKPSISVTLKAIDFEGGTGKNTGRLGAIICDGIEDGVYFWVKVGGGFTDEQRVDFWANREKIVNHEVEIKADCVVKGENHEYSSLRFPRFSCFRGFDPNEKI